LSYGKQVITWITKFVSALGLMVFPVFRNPNSSLGSYKNTVYSVIILIPVVINNTNLTIPDIGINIWNTANHFAFNIYLRIDKYRIKQLYLWTAKIFLKVYLKHIKNILLICDNGNFNSVIFTIIPLSIYCKYMYLIYII